VPQLDEHGVGVIGSEKIEFLGQRQFGQAAAQVDLAGLVFEALEQGDNLRWKGVGIILRADEGGGGQKGSEQQNDGFQFHNG